MSTTTTPPTVPPGWQRRQGLIAALAAIQEEVEEVRRVLPAVNDGRLRPRVEDLLAVASELVEVHGREPGDDVAEALAGLQSATRKLHVPINDPVLDVSDGDASYPFEPRKAGLRSAVDGALDPRCVPPRMSNRPDIAERHAGLPRRCRSRPC